MLNFRENSLPTTTSVILNVLHEKLYFNYNSILISPLYKTSIFPRSILKPLRTKLDDITLLNLRHSCALYIYFFSLDTFGIMKCILAYSFFPVMFIFISVNKCFHLVLASGLHFTRHSLARGFCCHFIFILNISII